MDIEEIKERKEIAEQEICCIVDSLENKTGVIVTNLSLGNRVIVIGSGSYVERVNLMMEV